MLSKELIAAAGNAGGESLYVEDVFSTYLYAGDGTTDPFPIVNGIDLANEGGLVWHKKRSTPAQSHALVDTVRGGSSFLSTNSSNAATTGLDIIDSFNEDGFDLALNTITNESAKEYATWTFRKAEKFFDVVTYTGNGTDATPAFEHSLGSTPAFIMIKKLNTATNWVCYHKDLSSPTANYISINQTIAETSFINPWINVTDTNVSLYGHSLINGSGQPYVAYLFASDAGGFGDDGSENIIKCGSYTSTYPTKLDVNLGFEPQWVIIKKSNAVGNWVMMDTMRGLPSGNNDQYLLANTSNFEGTFSLGGAISPTATGFTVDMNGWNDVDFDNGDTFIYIAIRRPMKTPESGTEVFGITPQDGTDRPTYKVPFVADMAIRRNTAVVSSNIVVSRLQGDKQMDTENTSAESAYVITGWDYMDGWGDFGSSLDTSTLAYMFQRATGFFDVVAYTGNGSNTTQPHNLGVAPEMMIVKRRDNTGNWTVYDASYGGQYYLRVNTDAAAALSSTIWNDTDPTSSVFTLGAGVNVNGSGSTYIAYLFATLAGVSKVGSYTGTGADLNVDCGFSAGARFILIKRTDSTGNWYVWDSVRGIVAGNDPYFLLNSSAAEVTSTDYIDPLSSGFTVTSSAPAALNASGGTYIFLAIA